MGERFGSYDLIEKIAVGGMAEIFKARAVHGRGVEKLVCIKRIHPALSADKDFVGMFIDEARLGVTMVHGNIVPVFDFGCIDGRYYLALEYVEGQDLAGLHGRARVVGIEWPLELAVYVVTEVLEGLIYAHHKRDTQGRPLELVHRDVSPSNILVSRDGQVKLLDFGIARSAVREFETRTGVIKGKPGYMSPEQAAGWAVDSRADVWSCGAVLHELVAGTRLKDGRVRVGDADVDAVLDKALAAKLEDRYADTAGLQRALFDLLGRRGFRPRASDLTAFIDRVQAARAPGEDWDMQSTGVEERLAALELRTGDEGSGVRTQEVGGEVSVLAETVVAGERETRTEGRTRQVTAAIDAPGRTGRRLAVAIAAVGLLVAAGAVAAWIGLGGPDTSPGPVAAGPAGDPPGPGPAGNAAARETPDPKHPPAPPPIATPDAGSEPAAAKGPDGGAGASPAGDEPRTKAPAAPPPRKATLNVVTHPWSTVTLDGRRIGDTPIKDLAISPGRHRLVLTNPVKNVSKEVVVHLKPGETKLVSERLE
jgi:serine/threonine-protein kinase